MAAFAAAPPVPESPAAVTDLIYAQNFTLGDSYQSTWRSEKPAVTSGLLIVVEVDPDLVYPRQQPEPVLYVGVQTAERLNVGFRSGHVVAVVPSSVDLTTSPIWFGDPAMPETLNEDSISAQRDKASKAGIKPFSADKIAAAQKSGGAALTLADQSALHRVAGALIARFSPQEQDLAASLQKTGLN
jgi:hypothetical protein